MRNRIIQINSVVNTGSTGRITEEIGQTTIAKGWQSYIAYGRYERPSQSQLIRIGTVWDNQLHGLQTRLFDSHGLGSIKATKKLIEQIKIINPDLIHLHNLHGYYLNIEILFSYLKNINIPVVWTLHDCWPMTGHCTYFNFVDCNKWKSECNQCPQKKEYPYSFWMDRSRKNYYLKKELFTSVRNLTLVPVSQWLADIVIQSFLSKVPFQVIHNGINTDVFKPLTDSTIRDKYKLQDKFILLGVAGIWSPRKGLKDFIELSKQLNPDYQIILVGLNQSQLNQLPRNIIGIAKTESVEELAEIYSSADAFINPTWEDNFPTTNLEALACGTPVITYRTGGSPEAIDSETGIIVEKGDVDGLIQSIKQIQEKAKSSYSAACRERAEKLYNKDNRYMDYLKLYESLIENQ